MNGAESVPNFLYLLSQVPLCQSMTINLRVLAVAVLCLGPAAAADKLPMPGLGSCTATARPFPALVQTSPTGAYVVTDAAGNPPVAGAVITSAIAPVPFTNVFVARVFIDYGNGPVPIPGEGMLITECFCGGYLWVNERGVEGNLSRQPDGTWRTIVSTGPNAGTVRRLNPSN